MTPRRILSALLLPLLTTGPAVAEPDRISFLLGSYHASPAQDFEEFNPGVFFTWERPVIDTSVGVFRNSYGRGALAVTGALPFVERENFQLAAFLGAAWYPDDGRRFRYHVGDIVPLGGLQARVGPVFLQAIPGDGDEADAIFAFGVTLPLGRR